MQQKGLFAALLCGAICLTGCLKNIESESVTEVRKAKAQELISVANLNNAQAEAETIKAKAEATIAAAQAELLQAQAAIASAEALRLTVLAELDAVNVEIAKVKLESEKVKLQEQKARLEQTMAEIEAAIAKANLAKETALIQLAKAQKQAEIDQITMQKNLIAAEQEMLKQAEKLDAETAKALKTAWFNYSDAMEKYYAAVADLLKTEAQIATMENDMEYGLSVMSAKLQYLEQRVASLYDEIEYLKSFELYSTDELNAAYAAALVDYEAALTEQKIAIDNEDYINDYYEAYKAMLTPNGEGDKLAYIFNWQDGFISFLKNQLADMDVDLVASIDENNVPVIGVQIPQEDKLPFFAPLFTGSYKWAFPTGRTIDPFYGSVEVVPTGEYYPLIQDGVISEYAIPVTKAEFTPANIYSENIQILLGILELKAVADAADAQIELDKEYDKVVNGQINKTEPNEIGPVAPEYDGSTPGLLETIDTYQAIYDAMKKYVDEANAVLEPAYAQIPIAENNYKVAQEEFRAAVVELTAYNMGQTDFAKYQEAEYATSLAKADVKAAAKEVRKAARKVRGIHKALYGEIEEDWEEPDPDDDDFGPEYGGFINDEGLLTKQAVMAAAVTAQEVVVAEAKAKVTTAIVEAYETAKANLEKQIDEVIPEKYAAERKAWNEYQAAFAAWTINPTEATEKTYKEKKAAYYGTETEGTVVTKGALQLLEEAIAETQATEEGNKTLKDKLIKAKAAYDEVNDPYETEAKILEFAQQQKAQIDEAVTEAQTALTLAEEGLVFAKAALDGAKEALEAAKEAEKEAYDKIKWVENPSFDNMPAEEVALIKNVIAAMKGASDAEKALDQDWENYLALYDAYNKVVIPAEEPGADPTIINLYEEYTDQLDPEFAKLSRRDRPSDVDEWGWHEPVYSYTEGKEPSIAQKLNNAKKHLATVENTYAEEKQAIVDAATYAAEGIVAVSEAISKYDAVKEDYLAFGAAMVNAYDTDMEAKEKIVDANIKVDAAEAMLDAIYYVSTRVIFVGIGPDGNPGEFTAEGIEDLIYFIQTGKYYDAEEEKYKTVDPSEFLCIEKCYERMAQIEEAMAMYFVDPQVNAKELSELKAKANSLQKRIEVYNALVEMYANQIAALTGNNPEVE